MVAFSGGLPCIHTCITEINPIQNPRFLRKLAIQKTVGKHLIIDRDIRKTYINGEYIAASWSVDWNGSHIQVSVQQLTRILWIDELWGIVISIFYCQDHCGILEGVVYCKTEKALFISHNMYQYLCTSRKLEHVNLLTIFLTPLP